MAATKKPKRPRSVARFVTAAKHAKNVAAHAAMVPEALEQLRAHGIGAKDARQLEFFFATNSKAKATALVEMLNVHEYAVTMVRAGTKFMVAGLTPAIPMSKRALSDWSRDMVALGFEFDSLFDGWNLVSTVER